MIRSLALLLLPAAVMAQQTQDSSFEAWPTTAESPTWEVQRVGRESIRTKLTVDCVRDEARSKTGNNCLALSIPPDTQGFEYVTVGQRLRLAAEKEYTASVWVRWPDWPDESPAGASGTAEYPSAIVSFWARHRDGQGSFAGRDEWLFDNKWHHLEFRFSAIDPGERTFIYISLLPNQKPVHTTVLVDDFELKASPTTIENESRTGNLVQDSSFDGQEDRIAAPWSFASMGGQSVKATVHRSGTDPFVRVAIANGTSNFESGQLWQHLQLQRGVRYEISCRIRWDNFEPDVAPHIVNYGIYHEATRTWYGPVDQVLNKTSDWASYRFTHIPAFTGPWKLYLQLIGWGNFGQAVTVSLDDITCTPAR